MSELTWRRIGAWQGGTVHSLALSVDATSTQDAIALAATDAGVFCSVDGGREWVRTRELAYAAAQVVAFAAQGAPTAFAATREGRLFRSHDAGASWQPMASWAFGPINALAFSPNFEADATLFAATPNGIYRSQEGGRTWQSANFGLLDSEILCLVCAPDFASSEVVWAGSAAGGVYRSRNAGRAWRESGEGLADSAVQCLAYMGSTLFAGTEGAGVFRLASGGQWEACGLEGLVVNDLDDCEGRVWAGTDAGAFCLDQENQLWHRTLADENMLALAAAPGRRLIAGGMMKAVQISADGGRTWQRAEGLVAHVPPLAALAPDGALFLFDVAGNAACLREDGLIPSANKPGFAKAVFGSKPGLFARPLAQSSSGLSISWNEISLQDGPIVCAATSGTAQQPAVWAATERAVLRWQAQAQAFEALPNQPGLHAEDAICTLAATPDGTLLLGTRQGVVAILLAGSTMWHSVLVPGANAISTAQLTPTGGLFVMCLAPAGAAFNAEVWQLPTLVLPMTQPSADWRMVVALDSLHTPLACMRVANTAEGETVLLAGQNMIAVASLAVGETHTTNLPEGTTITAMVAAHNHLFAATNRGLFASGDDGRTWQPCAAEVGDVPVVALLADVQGVRAVTLGGDVWRGGVSPA